MALCGAVAVRRRAEVARLAKQYWEGEWICADCGYIYNERLRKGLRAVLGWRVGVLGVMDKAFRGSSRVFASREGFGA